jgi:hypothetical protein
LLPSFEKWKMSALSTSHFLLCLKYVSVTRTSYSTHSEDQGACIHSMKISFHEHFQTAIRDCHTLHTRCLLSLLEMKRTTLSLGLKNKSYLLDWVYSCAMNTQITLKLEKTKLYCG